MKPSAKYADLSGKKRYPKESGIALTIAFDQLPAMIAELSAINRKLDAMTVTTEMW